MTWMDREGTFRAEVVEAVVRRFDSGAACVAFLFQATGQHDPGNMDYEKDADGYIAWHPSWPGDISHNHFIVLKDKTLATERVEELCRFFGWNGNLDNVEMMVGQRCQIVVKADEYKGETRYKGAFLRGWDAVPGIPSASPEEVKGLSQTFGGQLRAIAGAVKKDAGKEATQPPPTGAAPSGEEKPDDVPF